MNSADCKTEFRVEKADFPRLADALHIPAVFHCKQRSICDGLEGLCVLMRRTSYPCRFSDMIQRFPRPVSVLSLITNEVMDFIYDNHCHLVTEWNRDVLSSVALQQYAETISRKMNFCLRGTQTLRGYARWLWASERNGELRLFPSWPTYVRLWRSGLPPPGSSSGAISPGTSNPTIINSLKFLDYKKNLKIGLSSVGNMVIRRLSFSTWSRKL